MAKERRDSKNRLLNKGEYQKSDGRYMFRYTDASGEARTIYSWTLTQTDRTPKGKEPGKCLRELESEIAKDLADGIDNHSAQKTTLNELFDSMINDMRGRKNTTRNNYIYRYEKYVRCKIGNMRISEIKYSTIKKFYESIVYDDGLCVNSLKSINAILNPVFARAVRDGLIRTNPTRGVVTEIQKQSGQRQEKRHPLTEAQQKAFMDYVREDGFYRRYDTMFTVMLGTGVRVSELVGLTWDNCDFKNGIITIDHNLLYGADADTKKFKMYIDTPKTHASKREIPMFDSVKQALIKERARQMRDGFCETVIDGHTGFIFFTRKGEPFKAPGVNEIIKNIIKKYNESETVLAKKQKREPVFLPNFSPHILRHTFCTRLCENEVNIKVIQEIMGHTSASITMDIYSEATKDKKVSAFEKLEGRMLV